MATPTKTHIDYLQSHSLRELFNQVNSYNASHSDSPILKEDIVGIQKDESTYILIYFR